MLISRINENEEFKPKEFFVGSSKERILKNLENLTLIEKFYASIKGNCIWLLKQCIGDGVDPSRPANLPLEWADSLGLDDVVKELLNDPRVYNKLNKKEKSYYENHFRKKIVPESINEISHPNRAGSRLHNIDNALSELYDQMSKSDRNFKDIIFSHYYRFYNDGDIYRFPYETLSKMGVSEIGIHNLKDPFSYTASARREANLGGYKYLFNRYKEGLEEVINIVMKYFLKKYGGKLNRLELYLKERKENFGDILSNFESYYVIKYGKEFGINRLIEIGKKIEMLIKSGNTIPSELKNEIITIITNDIEKNEKISKSSKNEIKFNESLEDDEPYEPKEFFVGPSKERILKNLENLTLIEKFEQALENMVRWLIDECIENGVLRFYDIPEQFNISVEFNLPGVLRDSLHDLRMPNRDIIKNPIYIASNRGYVEIVKILLKDGRFDPTLDCNCAVKYAKNQEIRDELLKDERTPKFDIKKYSRGYKIYDVLKFIDKFNPTRSEIARYAYELSWGEGTFDNRCNGSYWTDYFNSPTTYKFGRPQGLINKCADVIDKHYFLNDFGKEYLRKSKFWKNN